MTHSRDIRNNFISAQEHARLVRLCATIMGRSEGAEDVAQETLLEAWRHLEQLHDPEKRWQWLSGIARNVCLRWARQRGRDQMVIPLDSPAWQEGMAPEEIIADAFDVEIELERKELITLLDRALEAVAPETRIALVKHYVDESPLREIAAQLGTNASAIAMRLQRGKLILRRVLTTQMEDEIAPYGFSLPKRNSWEETRLWCALCGQRHLWGKLDPDEGHLELKCPACCQESGVVYHQSHYPTLLRGVTSYKRAFSKLAVWERTYYRSGLDHGTAPCIQCGRPTLACRLHPGEAPKLYYGGEYRRLFGSDQRHGIAFICSSCEMSCVTLSDGIAQWAPETQQFLREHPKVRTLPECEIEVNGRAALLTTRESVTDNARLEVVTALDTYETLHISGR